MAYEWCEGNVFTKGLNYCSLLITISSKKSHLQIKAVLSKVSSLFQLNKWLISINQVVIFKR